MKAILTTNQEVRDKYHERVALLLGNAHAVLDGIVNDLARFAKGRRDGGDWKEDIIDTDTVEQICEKASIKGTGLIHGPGKKASTTFATLTKALYNKLLF